MELRIEGQPNVGLATVTQTGFGASTFTYLHRFSPDRTIRYRSWGRWLPLLIALHCTSGVLISFTGFNGVMAIAARRLPKIFR
jgi:hypothetical protein